MTVTEIQTRPEVSVPTDLHTVYVLCGPTFCGKSTFAKRLQSALSTNGACQILSSDAFRQQLLGNLWVDAYNIHHHDPRMSEMSREEFNLLYTQYKSLLAFPVVCPYVIVDTTGMNEKFRQDMVKIAKDAQYKVVLVTFEYRNTSEYYRYVDEADRRIAGFSVDRFRRKVLPELKARDFDARVRIRDRDFELVLVETEPSGFHFIQGEQEVVCVIGDTHESVKALTELLEKVRGQVNCTSRITFVHVGDYLDKGGNTIEMVNLMFQLVTTAEPDRPADRHILVSGNHENYVYKRLKGQLPENKALESAYFTSVEALTADPRVATKFFTLWEHYTFPFVQIIGEGQRTLYVTHAPCQEKYLGKTDDFSMRQQRNLYRKDFNEDSRKSYEWLFQEANYSRPVHVFGHVAHANPTLEFKNKIFLDTGAVYGNQLTAMLWQHNRYEFVQVKPEALCATDREDGLSKVANVMEREEKPFNIQDYDLEPEDLRFLNGAMRNGVKYISGTMAPAPSTATDLESLDSAFDYMRRHGVVEVVLQPKYMGSRCQFYLYSDPEKKSFAVSRNGYVIRHVEALHKELERWKTKVKGIAPDDWSEVILDGELLPWSALGKGLIDDHFHSYASLVKDELNTLAGDADFLKLGLETTETLEKKLGQLKVFNETVSLYDGETTEETLEFRPFDVLSIDGPELANLGPHMAFLTVSDDEPLLVALEDEAQVEKARAYYANLTVEHGMEGVVVKPTGWKAEGHTAPPYMKVRNPRYLTLVYGYDYEDRIERLCAQKNISGKVRTSIAEHKLAMQMLTASEDGRKECIVKMIGELKREKTLDPRL